GINLRHKWSLTVETYTFCSPRPANFERSVGRPSKAGRIDPEEPQKKGKKEERKATMKLKKQKPIVRFKRCGMAGYNVRSCDKRKDQVTREVDNTSLNKAFDTILERKRVAAVKSRKIKMAKVGIRQSSNNSTLFPLVVGHQEEDVDL
ncbi:epididymal-specific lipocalin-10, partial [Striga asiatica]